MNRSVVQRHPDAAMQRIIDEAPIARDDDSRLLLIARVGNEDPSGASRKAPLADIHDDILRRSVEDSFIECQGSLTSQHEQCGFFHRGSTPRLRDLSQ